jgi:hypothetical protein
MNVVGEVQVRKVGMIDNKNGVSWEKTRRTLYNFLKGNGKTPTSRGNGKIPTS